MTKANDPSKVFEERVLRGEPHECWGFEGYHNKQGYPTVWINGSQKKVSHISLMLDGKPRPAHRALALHSCDNPRCVNPRHLRWGTHKENAQDRRERTGYGQLEGERNPNWVRTSELVKAVLSRPQATSAELVRLLGVSKPTINRIRREAGVTKKSGPPTVAQARVLAALVEWGAGDWVQISGPEMAARLGMHGPGVHRALHILLERGLVQKDEQPLPSPTRWRVT